MAGLSIEVESAGLKRLEARLGANCVEALGEHYGGTYLSVPRYYRGDHPLVTLLGADAVSRLIDCYGGLRVYIAMKASRDRRNDELRREHQAGASVAVLARERGMSERQIWRIIRG